MLRIKRQFRPRVADEKLSHEFVSYVFSGESRVSEMDEENAEEITEQKFVCN